jgi:hypothetical protein
LTEQTLDEGEMRRAQQVHAELTAHWLARLDDLHGRAKAMVADLGFRTEIGPIAAERGADLVRHYAALVDRALNPWGRHEAEPTLKQIKKSEHSDNQAQENQQ